MKNHAGEKVKKYFEASDMSVTEFALRLIFCKFLSIIELLINKKVIVNKCFGKDLLFSYFSPVFVIAY